MSEESENKNFIVNCKVKVRGNGDNYQLGYNKDEGIFIARTNLSNMPSDYESVYNQLVKYDKTQKENYIREVERKENNSCEVAIFLWINIIVSFYVAIESIFLIGGIIDQSYNGPHEIMTDTCLNAWNGMLVLFCTNLLTTDLLTNMWSVCNYHYNDQRYSLRQSLSRAYWWIYIIKLIVNYGVRFWPTIAYWHIQYHIDDPNTCGSAYFRGMLAESMFILFGLPIASVIYGIVIGIFRCIDCYRKDIGELKKKNKEIESKYNQTEIEMQELRKELDNTKNKLKITEHDLEEAKQPVIALESKDNSGDHPVAQVAM